MTGNVRLSNTQTIMVVLLVGTPIALYFVLNFINPGFMHYMGHNLGPLPGFWWMMLFQAINLLVLVFGFKAVNRPDAEHRSRRMSTLVVASLIIFTVPSIVFVVLFPAFAARVAS